MGSYLSKPITDKETEEKSNAKLKCGISSMQGWRDTQEDAHNCILDYDLDTSYFAVYDGHGGRAVAEYCSLELPKYIKNLYTYKEGNIEKALIEGFMGFDKSLISYKVDKKLKSLTSYKLTQLRNRCFEEDDVDSDEDEVKYLYEEASMSLEQVMEKYAQGEKRVTSVKKDSDTTVGTSSSCSSVVSKAGSSSECCNDGVSSSSSDIKDPKTSQSSSNGDHSIDLSCRTDDQEFDNKADAQSSDAKEAECVHNNDGDNKVHAQNGDSDNVTSSSQENGNMSVRGKGKAIVSGKQQKTPTRAIKTRPKLNDEKLYKDLLDNDESSDSEEEDETFEEPKKINSDDDSSEVEAVESSDASSEEEEDVEDEIEEEKEGEEENNVDRIGNKGCYYVGSTAVVAILKGQKLYVANAGDSRCVVCREGKAIEMTSDHKPEDEPECSRIQKAGGYVCQGRVDEELNLSRAFGDFKYKTNKNLPPEEQKIIALPDVRTLDILPGQDEFMILACDGIWTSMSGQEAVDFIRPKIKKGKKLTNICEELFDHLISPNGWATKDGVGCDNMTALIIQFNSTAVKRSVSPESAGDGDKRVKTEESDPHVDTTATV